MAQFKLNPTQGLAFEIKLRGTPQFNFHTISNNKINPNRIRLNKVEPKKSNNSKYSHSSNTLSLIQIKVLITRIFEKAEILLKLIFTALPRIFFEIHIF